MRLEVRVYDPRIKAVINKACVTISTFMKTKDASASQVREAIAMEDLDYITLGNDHFVVLTPKSISWRKDRNELYRKIVEIEQNKVERKKTKEVSGKKFHSPWQ